MLPISDSHLALSLQASRKRPMSSFTSCSITAILYRYPISFSHLLYPCKPLGILLSHVPLLAPTLQASRKSSNSDFHIAISIQASRKPTISDSHLLYPCKHQGSILCQVSHLALSLQSYTGLLSCYPIYSIPVRL